MAEKSTTPLFSAAEVAQMRLFWEEFKSNGLKGLPSWAIDSGQPYALDALTALSRLVEDRDHSVWPALKAGVPIGVQGDIPPSHVFVPKPCPLTPSDDVLLCTGRKGAEENPELLAQLIQKEVDSGWLVAVESEEEEARKLLWPRLAIGKLNIVHNAGRDPRLIIDPSVSGTNAACQIPEKCSLPGLFDVRSSFPL